MAPLSVHYQSRTDSSYVLLLSRPCSYEQLVFIDQKLPESALKNHLALRVDLVTCGEVCPNQSLEESRTTHPPTAKGRMTGSTGESTNRARLAFQGP